MGLDSADLGLNIVAGVGITDVKAPLIASCILPLTGVCEDDVYSFMDSFALEASLKERGIAPALLPTERSFTGWPSSASTAALTVSYQRHYNIYSQQSLLYIYLSEA